jgi:hypothetical protein
MKLDNHVVAVALNVAHYNLCRTHEGSQVVWVSGAFGMLVCLGLGPGAGSSSSEIGTIPDWCEAATGVIA